MNVVVFAANVATKFYKLNNLSETNLFITTSADLCDRIIIIQKSLTANETFFPLLGNIIRANNKFYSDLEIDPRTFHIPFRFNRLP